MEDCELDEESEALTGKPFFHLLLQKSHILYPLVIPVRIARILLSITVPVELSYGIKTWKTSYQGKYPMHMRFNSRWKTFVADKKLKEGDACLFELMENETKIMKFKVQILRGDFPRELLVRIEGSEEWPLVID